MPRSPLLKPAPSTGSGAPTPTFADSLLLRILSALILLPLVVGVIVFGSPATEIMVAIFVFIMGYEWMGLQTSARRVQRSLAILLSLALVLSLPVCVRFGFMSALLMLVVAGGLLGWAAPYLQPHLHGRHRFFFMFGILYLGLPALAFVDIAQGETGQKLILWALACAVYTDTGAYFVGRAVGGARLAPTISPNKTWAGAWGGFVLASMLGGLTAMILQFPLEWWAAIIFSGILSVAGIFGDLLESWMKRIAGRKNSGTLIPGHGGVLDRADSMMLILPVLLVLMWVLGWQ